MKKSIIFSLIAMTFVAFTVTSCNPEKQKDPTNTSITGLTVKPSQLVLSVGESTRLAYVTELTPPIVINLIPSAASLGGLSTT